MSNSNICTRPDKRNGYITENLGLVHACAQRYKGKGIDYEDLYQAGCVGLIKASDGFEEERGLRFSTYAVPLILGEIRRLFRDGGAVKVSRSLKELALRAKRQQDNFVKVYGREPTVQELATELQVDAETLTEALCASAPPLSLTVGEDDSQLDIACDSPMEALSERIALKQLLDNLETKDRQLIILRYFKGWTQVKTTSVLGMTQVQVSRKEKKILDNLRDRW